MTEAPAARSAGHAAGGPRPPLRIQQGDAARASWQIKVLFLALKCIFLLIFRVRIIGRENLPARNAVIAGNHLGWAEGFMVLLFLPVEPRIYILGDQQMAYGAPWQTWVGNWLAMGVPLDRDNRSQALEAMEDLVRRGGSMAIAPEGQLGKQEGTIGPLKPGAAILSQRSGAPLVPIGVTGTLEVWLRCRLTMRIGKPIYPGEFSGEPRARVDAMTARLDRELRALLPGDVDHPRWKPLRSQLTKLF